MYFSIMIATTHLQSFILSNPKAYLNYKRNLANYYTQLL